MKLDRHDQIQGLTLTDGTLDISGIGSEFAINLAQRARLVALLAAAIGVAAAIFWSYELVDTVIGASIANTALGVDAKSVDIGMGGPLLDVFFAFAVGLAATFTACNCVVFSCMAPLFAHKHQQQTSLAAILGWLVVGVVVVTALYGVFGARFAQAVPALGSGTVAIGRGYPLRLVQSTVIFTILGAIFVW